MPSLGSRQQGFYIITQTKTFSWDLQSSGERDKTTNKIRFMEVRGSINEENSREKKG